MTELEAARFAYRFESCRAKIGEGEEAACNSSAFTVIGQRLIQTLSFDNGLTVKLSFSSSEIDSLIDRLQILRAQL